MTEGATDGGCMAVDVAREGKKEIRRRNDGRVVQTN